MLHGAFAGMINWRPRVTSHDQYELRHRLRKKGVSRKQYFKRLYKAHQLFPRGLRILEMETERLECVQVEPNQRLRCSGLL